MGGYLSRPIDFTIVITQTLELDLCPAYSRLLRN